MFKEEGDLLDSSKKQYWCTAGSSLNPRSRLVRTVMAPVLVQL